jgi:hypothetical protein
MVWQELKAKALANPMGKVVCQDAMFPDINNIGSWDGIETYMDIYTDIVNAIERLSGIPKTIIGSRKTLKPLCFRIDERGGLVWLQIAPYFWFSNASFPGEKDFIKFDESAEYGLVIVTDDLGNAVLINTT